MYIETDQPSRHSSVVGAAKRSAGVTPEVNIGECVTCTPLKSVNKAAHSGFESQKTRQEKSKTRGISGPQKGLMTSKYF